MGNFFGSYLLAIKGWLGVLLLCMLIGGAAGCLLLNGSASAALARSEAVAEPGPGAQEALAPLVASSHADIYRCQPGAQGARLQLGAQLAERGCQDVAPAVAAGAPGVARVLPGALPGAAGGVLLALMLAALLAWRSRRPVALERVRDALGMEIVARVPLCSRRARQAALPLAAAERYRSLCARLRALPQPVKLVMFASAQAGEGKSTLVSDVAIHLARAGERVLLVDLHLRRPAIAQRFGLTGRAGLTDLLACSGAGLPLEQYCQPCPDAGLYVLAAGSALLKPFALLRTLTATQFFPRLLQAPFDYVLCDTPALLTGVETQLLVASGGALVLVVQNARTSRRALARTRQLLAHLCVSQMVGVALNRWSGRAAEDGVLHAPPASWPDPAPRRYVEEVTRELPVVSTRPYVIPEAIGGQTPLPDTGETAQIHGIAPERIIRPPISLSGLQGATNGLLGRSLGAGATTPVPSSLRGPEGETRDDLL